MQEPVATSSSVPSTSIGQQQEIREASGMTPPLAAQTQTTATEDAANTSAGLTSAQVPVLPVADMQALAKRIGMANKVTAQTDLPTLAAVHPDLRTGIPSSQSSAVVPTVSAAAITAAGGVPAEIQAIIEKLVHFIKVGPPGQVCTRQHPLFGAWPGRQMSTAAG